MPQECLILTMKANQKYFPLLDAQRQADQQVPGGQQHPARTTPSAVIGGNERVVRPRLADAKFFFDQDRKKTLASRVAGLAKVVYHNKLGTQGERVERVRAIAKAIGAQLGGDHAGARRPTQAAQLAKADLLTDMVGEFPELQGIMGRYYALPRRPGRRRRRRHRRPLQAALRRRRAAAQRRRASWWRWPTSWRPWPACSPSASCPPATRTRSRCAAMRWASCAC